jgi:hypothetical protein
MEIYILAVSVADKWIWTTYKTILCYRPGFRSVAWTYPPGTYEVLWCEGFKHTHARTQTNVYKIYIHDKNIYRTVVTWVTNYRTTNTHTHVVFLNSANNQSPSRGNNYNNQTFICQTPARTWILQSLSESPTFTGNCFTSKYVCVYHTSV